MQTKDVVAEIHNDFETAQERLLKEAKRIIERPHVELTLKAERLNKLGFTKSKDARIGQSVIDNHAKHKELIGSIEYFQQRYPFNKFINEDEVERLCKKYGLVFAAADKYIGEIPEKNIQEIERFELNEEDIVEMVSFRWQSMDFYFKAYTDLIQPLSGNVKDKPKETTVKEKKKQPFKIVAPYKDFDTTDMELKGHRLEQNLPDPIVLQPVKGGYLIVTKWGLEASDELVVNEINN